MRLTFERERDPALPPGDDEVSAERLFRLLLRVPRAVLPIDYRVPAAPHVALSVRALTGPEESSAWDDARAMRTTSARNSTLVAGLIERSLWTPSGKAFASVEQVGQLDTHAATQLGAQVVAALCIVSPTYGSIDYRAWLRRLEQGARHISNAHQSAMIAECVDVSLGSGVRWTTPRPDRFFGLRTGALTDGQHLVFSAALSVCEARRKRAAESD